MARILFFAAAALAAPALLARQDSSCTAGTITVGDQQCTIECGQDRPGGDYASMPESDFQGCVDACSADSYCQTAQYDSSNGYCYLKDGIQASTPNPNVDGIVCPGRASTEPQCTAGQVNINGRDGVVECETDHPGGDYRSVTAATFEDCENACASDSTCMTAQFNVDTQWCYLKNAVNEAVPKSGTWSITYSS